MNDMCFCVGSWLHFDLLSLHLEFVKNNMLLISYVIFKLYLQVTSVAAQFNMFLSKERLKVNNLGGFLTAYISDEVNEEIYMSFDDLYKYSFNIHLF